MFRKFFNYQSLILFFLILDKLFLTICKIYELVLSMNHNIKNYF